MVELEIAIDMGGTIEHMEAMLARSHNFMPALEKAKRSLGNYNAVNFLSQGGLVGGWRIRSLETHAGWPILIRTGTLMGSLTALDGPPNHIGLTSATFGTSVDYAKFHQSGTFKMPSRQIVFEPKGWAREVANDCVNHILGLDLEIG
jgi:phage gpG-like protein